YGVRTGPRRLAADVDQVRPHVDEIEAMAEGGLGVEVATAIGERVRGDVEDPHDPRAIEDNLSRSMAPDCGLVPHSGEQRRIPISRYAGARQERYTSARSPGRSCGSCSSMRLTSR